MIFLNILMLLCNFAYAAEDESEFTSLIQDLLVEKINEERYHRFSLSKTPSIYNITISRNLVFLETKKDKEMFSYVNYIINGNESDFLVDVVYHLYKLNDESHNKILTFNLPLARTSEVIPLFFKNIPRSIIEKMIKKYRIEKFNEDYLKFSDVITGISDYKTRVRSTDWKFINSTKFCVFDINLKKRNWCFRLNLSEVGLENIITIADAEYKKIQEAVSDLKSFVLVEYLNILLRNYVWEYPGMNLNQVPTIPKLKSDALSSVRTKNIFFRLSDTLLNNDIFLENYINNSLYVYTADKFLGINKTLFTLNNESSDAIFITEKTYQDIIRYFNMENDAWNHNLDETAGNFYLLMTSGLLELALKQCLSERLSSDSIIFLSIAMFLDIINLEEYRALLKIEDQKNWEESIDKIIKNLTKKSTFEICSSKYYMLQHFITSKIWLWVYDKNLKLDNRELFEDFNLVLKQSFRKVHPLACNFFKEATRGVLRSLVKILKNDKKFIKLLNSEFKDKNESHNTQLEEVALDNIFIPLLRDKYVEEKEAKGEKMCCF